MQFINFDEIKKHLEASADFRALKDDECKEENNLFSIGDVQESILVKVFNNSYTDTNSELVFSACRYNSRLSFNGKEYKAYAVDAFIADNHLAALNYVRFITKKRTSIYYDWWFIDKPVDFIEVFTKADPDRGLYRLGNTLPLVLSTLNAFITVNGENTVSNQVTLRNKIIGLVEILTNYNQYTLVENVTVFVCTEEAKLYLYFKDSKICKEYNLREVKEVGKFIDHFLTYLNIFHEPEKYNQFVFDSLSVNTGISVIITDNVKEEFETSRSPFPIFEPRLGYNVSIDLKANKVVIDYNPNVYQVVELGTATLPDKPNDVTAYRWLDYCLRSDWQAYFLKYAHYRIVKKIQHWFTEVTLTEEGCEINERLTSKERLYFTYRGTTFYITLTNNIDSFVTDGVISCNVYSVGCNCAHDVLPGHLVVTDKVNIGASLDLFLDKLTRCLTWWGKVLDELGYEDGYSPFQYTIGESLVSAELSPEFIKDEFKVKFAVELIKWSYSSNCASKMTNTRDVRYFNFDELSKLKTLLNLVITEVKSANLTDCETIFNELVK